MIIRQDFLFSTDADLAVRYFADQAGRCRIDVYYLRGAFRWIALSGEELVFPRGTRCIFDTVSLAHNVMRIRRDEPRMKECAVTFAEEGPARVQWLAPRGSTRRLFLVERSTPWGQALGERFTAALDGLFDGPTALRGASAERLGLTIVKDPGAK